MRSASKTLSLLLAVLFLIPALPFASSADAVTRFTVATDVHLRLPDSDIEVSYPESELYWHAWGSGNLTYEAGGILKSMFKQVREDGSEFVLLCGDLAHNGHREQHEYFTSLLREFERESGIPVYVVPGNHDYFNGYMPDDFRECYADFGYSEAIASDDKTASYSARLPGGFRLIAVDSNDPGDDGDGIDERLLRWIDSQALAAKNDGETPILMMHHPLLEPIAYGSVLMKDFVVRNSRSIAERFARDGITYVFTGHEHGNDISSYTALNGKIVYNILTTALSSYPLEYRSVELGKDKMDLKIKSIVDADPDYIPSVYNDAQRSLILNDFTAYSLGFFKYSVEQKIYRVISPEMIKDILGVEQGTLADAVDYVMPLVREALETPMHDGGDGGVSVEALAAKKGAKLPENDYISLMDMVTTVVAKIYEGGEDIPTDTSPEGKLLLISLDTLLGRLFTQIGDKVLPEDLFKILSVFGVKKAEELGIYTCSAGPVPGGDYRYAVAEASLASFLDKFLKDDAVPDRDAVLAGPGASVSVQERFNVLVSRLTEFLGYVLRFLRTALAVVG